MLLTAAAATLTAAGTLPLTRLWAKATAANTDANKPRPPTLKQRLISWTTERDTLSASLPGDHWQATRSEQRADLFSLRSSLINLHRSIADCPGLTWDGGVGMELKRRVWQWETDTGEALGLRCHAAPTRPMMLWDGDELSPLPADTGISRLMFLNIRHFKAGVDGWLLRDGIWDFASEWNIDWVGLSDHWLEAPPGPAGKWDRSGVGVTRETRYRTSGVQAAAARGYRDEGWGGDGMSWAFQQGLRGAAGAVGGTLLAARSGWDRANKEVSDRWNYGRFTGRAIIGEQLRQVIVVMAQGPTPSQEEGSQWMQQTRCMEARKRAGEPTEPNPSAQFLLDLYTVLEPHAIKGHAIIVGGDFNLHWGTGHSTGNCTFGNLEEWASALSLVHTATHLEHDLTTWKRSENLGAHESQPDHVFASSSLTSSGAVKALGCYQGHRVNNSDHSPLVLDIALGTALGLDNTGARLPAPPPRTPVKLLKTTDDKACHLFRTRAADLCDALALPTRLERLETLLAALLRTRESAKATGDDWRCYGKDTPDNELGDALQAWWLDAAKCLTDAQTHAHELPKVQARKGNKVKQDWSPSFIEIKELHHKALKLVNLIDNNRCGPETRNTLLQELQEQLNRNGRKGSLPAFPSGRHPPGILVQGWIKESRKMLAALLKEIHGRKRGEFRTLASEWHEKVVTSIALGKWKGLFRSELKKSFSSQDKHVIMVDVTDDTTGEKLGERLLTEKHDVMECARSFFAKWMGMGRAKWFRNAQHTHILHRDTDEGADARRALVRSELTPEQERQIADGLPAECDGVLHWWRRKRIWVESEQQEREIRDSDWDDVDLLGITPTEWVQCISKSAGNKAADAKGVHINLLKALLPPKTRKQQGPQEAPTEADTLHDALTARCTGLLQLIRRALVVILQSGVIPDCQLEQILCTIGKVEGSNALKDSRPLTLISITLNMAIGIQMSKVMHKLDDLKAIDDWQAGFRARVGTEEPLLETRLVAEHCWQYGHPLWAGDEDKKQAFDAPPESSCELAMDRLAIPYWYIRLIKLVGNKAKIMVRTAHGLTRHFCKNQGFPQGGRHSPSLWTIFDDPLCTAMNAETETDGGDPVTVNVPFARPVSVSGKSFADDKRFLSSTHAGLQRRFDMSAQWNLLNEIETNVSKSSVQALVQAPGSSCKLLTEADLADITMMNWVTGERETVVMHDPDEPLKSLGMQTTVALSDGYAVAEAKRKADRVGVCVAKGSAPAALWMKLITQVAQRSALYCIHTSSIGPNDITDIQARCHRAFKAKAGLCITTPNEVVSAIVTLDWASQHFIEQTVMVIKYLQRPGSKLEALLCSAIQQHALWQGGDSTLGALCATDRGWDSTLLGRLHLWLAANHLELKGPVKTPDSRAGDSLLRSHALSAADSDTLAAGSWIVEAWRVADCLCWDGSVTASLRTDGSWQREINKVTPGLGTAWRTIVIGILDALPETPELGLRARGAIRLGAYVCLPQDQGSAGITDGTLVLGVVTADYRDDNGWEDQVQIRLLEPLPLTAGDPSPLISRFGHKLTLRVPYATDDLRSNRYDTRAPLARGTLYADCAYCLTTVVAASSLLEVKVVEAKLVHPVLLGPHTDKTTELLVQLDEELTPAQALALWRRGRVETPTAALSFCFPDMHLVIGRQAAAAHGWNSDMHQWDDLLALEVDRRALGLRTTLMLLSDGSVQGDGFSASSTYGWISYAVMLPGAGEPEYIDAPDGHVLAGGGKVAGPPEWTSSTRAEATGLLAALMGAVTAGWVGDIDLRLDNDSAVGRGGGLTLDLASEFYTDSCDDTAPDFVLRDAMTIENSDIWSEFTSWRDLHRNSGSTVTVSWHPGHPERRKCSYKSDWCRADHAIFRADLVAEDMHALPTPPRTPTQWSHGQAWKLCWRGTEQHGCIAQRLHDAVRTELLSSYIQSTGLGAGTDTEWVVPELLSRTIGRKEGTLKQKVHRAKVVASILGTKYTQHRRKGLDADDDPMCRLCAAHLETDNHVLWECSHPAIATKRRELAKAVRSAWRKTGLGLRELAIANLLWSLDSDDTVTCTSSGDIHGLLDNSDVYQADLLTASLLGHTLDTSGVAAERNGLFGKGWIDLLDSLGLARPAALNALVAVAAVLHGPHGTLSLWEAFTSILDTPEAHITDQSAAHTTVYNEWAVSIRDRLRTLKITDDQPYRTLTSMCALGMTADDRSQFANLVQAWLDSLLLPGAGAHEWAETLVDAIAQARVEVVDTRQRLGQKHIKVRELARADAKIAALERRTRRCLNPPAPPIRQRPLATGTTAAATAPATGKRKERAAPARVDAGRKTQRTTYKADKRKLSPAEQACDGGPATDTANDTETDTDTQCKRTDRKHKTDKRKQQHHDTTADTDADDGTDTNSKRACRKKKPEKRKRNELRGAAQGSKTANHKTTASKRKHDGDCEQGASHPTARQLRANIREQRKDCISDLEPD